MKSMAIISLALGILLANGAAEEVKPFRGSYQQALKNAVETGKPVMLEFYTDW